MHELSECARSRARGPRGRRIAALGVALALITAGGVLADGIDADGNGDSITSNHHVKYAAVADSASLACSTRGTAVLGHVEFKRGGNASDHFAPGASVTITADGNTAADAAGITVSASNATIPNDGSYDTNGDSYLAEDVLSTTVPATAPNSAADTPYEITVTATSGSLVKTDKYQVQIDCPAAPPPSPSNVAPTADAGGPYNGTEGTPAALDGTGSVDSDGTIASYAWAVTPQSGGSNDPDAGTSCSLDNAAVSQPNVTCTDDGIYDVTLTVTDDDGATDDDATTLTLTNANPTFNTGQPAFAAASVTCGANNATLNFGFTDLGSNDTHSASVNWGDGSPAEAASGTSATHTYNSGGPYTASVTVTDDDGGSTGAVNSTNTLIVEYNLSSILQPVNDTRNGQSISLFKYGSTVPTKVNITDCNGAHPSNLDVKVFYAKISADAPAGGAEEAAVSTVPDQGNNMRFSDPIYIFNWSTKAVNDPTCKVRITVKIPATNQSTYADIGLKK